MTEHLLLPPSPADDVRVVHGSSAHMGEIQDGAADLIVTSPPYFPASVETVLADGSGGASQEDRDRAIRDTIAYAWSLRPTFAECRRILRPGGWVVLQTRDVRFDDQLAPVEAVHRGLLESLGLGLYARHAWRPAHVTTARRRKMESLARRAGPTAFDMESFLVLRSRGPLRRGTPSPADAALLTSDVMRTAIGRQRVRHRWQSPIPVLRAFISAYSVAGDLVVDPFAGGGAVLSAARALGRRAVGYEIDPEAVAAIRINLCEDRPS